MRQQMRTIAAATLLSAFVMVAGARAADSQAKDDRDLLGVTCGHYQAALKAAVPGATATPAQKAAAVTAQDDIALIMLWVHGYMTGRAGTGAQAQPLTKAWIVAHVGQVSKVCTAVSPDGSKRLADVATQL